MSSDLDHILFHTEGLWEELRDEQIFVTGGTGFLGCWLLESFTWAVERLDLNAKAVVLTRDPRSFLKKAPHLANHSSIQLYTGDVRSFDFPEGHFSHVIHMATEASHKLNSEDPLLMIDTIVQGTRHTLDFSLGHDTKKFLLVSSGAVYGRQPSEITHIQEEYSGAPDSMDPCSAYGEGKRMAEHLCSLYHSRYGIESKIARGFAFVGPYLPLDIHFAVGNFIGDALKGRVIQVKGDGTPFRSYLYAADAIIWLWTILFRGKPCRPYNLGSEEDLTITDLARRVADVLEAPGIEIAGKPDLTKPLQRYVPSTRRARNDLGLLQHISLPEAIKRTAAWYQASIGAEHNVLGNCGCNIGKSCVPKTSTEGRKS